MKAWGLVLALAMASGLVACRPGEGERAEVDDIARLFVRLRLSSQTLEGQAEPARAARETILREAGTDPQEFKRRVAALRQSPDLWQPFWARVEALADSIEKAQRKGS